MPVRGPPVDGGGLVVVDAVVGFGGGPVPQGGVFGEVHPQSGQADVQPGQVHLAEEPGPGREPGTDEREVVLGGGAGRGRVVDLSR